MLIIPIDWKVLLKTINSSTNVTLFPGDEIEVVYVSMKE